MIRIRQLELGDGKPKIAVPISPQNLPDAGRLARAAASSGADFIELRADSFAEVEKKEMLLSLLRAVRGAAGEVPVLFTLRTAPEGGKLELSGKAFAEAVRTAVKSGMIDLVDIEAGRETAPELIREARAGGIPVVLSKHDFHATPGCEEIVAILRSMEEMGADIAKCAFMPVSAFDVTAALASQARAARELAIPSLVISMGEMGLSTRLAAEAYGAPFTFGCLPGEASAPGQIEAGELRSRLDALRRGDGIYFLTGFMGCGKSTVADALSKKLGVPAVEMDRRIEETEKMTISDIFRDRGEKHFRNLETQLLAGLYTEKSAVVSCGGGAVLRKENVALMRALGRIVLLTAEPETVLARLAGEAENRPNIRERLTEQGVAGLMEERRPFYENAADFIVRTDGRTVEEICAEILTLAKLRSKRE